MAVSNVGNSNLRKNLFEAIREIRRDIIEGSNYGVPHVFGEILNGTKVSLTVSVLENERLRMIMNSDNDGLIFVYPADDTDEARLFMDLWRFLRGKERDVVMKVGARIRGNLEEFLRRKGFEILWMNKRDETSGYVQAWITRGSIRYSTIFRRVGEDEFVLLEMKRV